jgi:integrase
MLAAGAPMRDIADQLGHANPSLTASVYAHVTPGRLEEALRRVDEALRTR